MTWTGTHKLLPEQPPEVLCLSHQGVQMPPACPAGGFGAAGRVRECCLRQRLHCLVVGCCLSCEAFTGKAFTGYKEQVQPPAGDLSCSPSTPAPFQQQAAAIYLEQHLRSVRSQRAMPQR